MTEQIENDFHRLNTEMIFLLFNSYLYSLNKTIPNGMKAQITT